MQDHDAGDTQKKPNNKSGQKDNQRNSSDFSEERQARQGGVEGDALAWLEGPAFNSPIEEMPTLQWPEVNADPSDEEDNSTEGMGLVRGNETKSEEPVENLEDAMNWLEELAAGQGTPIDEMPTLISGGQYDEIGPEDIEYNANPVEITGKTSTLADHDSDPMAWLEQLAVDQSSPLEELPSVADRLLASEIESQNDVDPPASASNTSSKPMSLEVEEAIFYLEQIAAKNGVDLEQVDIEQLQMGQPAGKSLVYIDQLVEVAPDHVPATGVESGAPAAVENDWEDLSTQIPDDPDEALQWLSALSEEEDFKEDAVDLEEEISLDSDSLRREAIQPESARKGLDVEVPVDDIQTFDDMPDDPDEAMAWMQKLAEQEDDVPAQKPDQQVERTQTKPPEGSYKKSSLDSELLTHARQALDAGNLDKATEYYQDILESGTGGSQIIQELEKAVDKEPESADLFRLLGDAYMQDGQMQKALKTYRKGFDHL